MNRNFGHAHLTAYILAFSLVALNASAFQPSLHSAFSSGFGTGPGAPFVSCKSITNEPTSAPTQPVLSHPHIFVILWGSNVWFDVADHAAEFYSDLATSSYLATLNDAYGVSTGMFKGIVSISPTTFDLNTNCRIDGTGCFITTDQINTEIQAQIAAGNVPVPTSDETQLSPSNCTPGGGFCEVVSNSLVYAVHLPPNLHLMDGNTESVGEHQTVTTNGGRVPVLYNVDFSGLLSV